MSFFYIFYLDKQMTSSLGPYIDSEVERLTTNIVTKTIRKVLSNQKIDTLLIENDSMESKTMSYNINKINDIKEKITNDVQETLDHLENADIEDYHLFKELNKGKYKKIKNGILAENTINSLRGTVIFANIGPSIPIRLYFVGQVNSKIEIKTKEYGINNILIELYLTISIKEQVMMPISSKKKEITIEELIATDIIRGNIPNYYSGFSK